MPIIGLYPGEDNTVVLELLDDSGRVEGFPGDHYYNRSLCRCIITDVIEPVETSGESAYDLTMVYGQSTHLPFAYDCMGDIRLVYEQRDWKLWPLHAFQLQNDLAGYCPDMFRTWRSLSLPIFMSWIIWEELTTCIIFPAEATMMVIEKEPGGNLLVLTSSMQRPL